MLEFLAAPLVSALAALIAALLARMAAFYRRRVSLPKPRESYAEKTRALTEGLATASMEVDKLFQEMASVATERQSGISNLEQQLEDLSNREQELKKKIEALEEVPLPAAEHLARLLDAQIESREKRSAQRDYALFALGVIVTTLVSVFIAYLG